MSDEQIVVKDGRLRGVFWVENDIYSNKRDISALAIALYILLCRLADDKGKIYANRGYLSKLSRISTGGVSKFTDELVKLGLIRVTERRQGSKKLPTEYLVLSAAERAEADGHLVTVTPCPSPHDGHQVTGKGDKQEEGGKTRIKGERQEGEKQKPRENHQDQNQGLLYVDSVENVEGGKDAVPKTDAEQRLERIGKEMRAEVRIVFAYYLKATGRNEKMYTLTEERMRVGLARLHDCWKKTDGSYAKAGELMRIAVDGLVSSEFHMGKNADGRRYVDWTSHLFKSTDKLEKWLEAD